MNTLESGSALSSATLVSEPIRSAEAIRRIVFNLPELMLINLQLWAVVAAAVWATGTLLHVSQLGYIIPAVIFGAPGLWATWQTFRLALAPIV